jgi:hypothetical protein
VDVADDAERLEVGCVLTMTGTAWFDDAALEVLGPAGGGNAPPAPLTDRGRANLTALARLLAYVRFFHPSDESAATAPAAWGRFAVGHVAYVEAARSPDELAARLTELFAPLAPTLRIYVTGRPLPAADALAAPPGGTAVRVVAWRHRGADPNGLLGHYKSERVADRDLPGAAPLKHSPEPLPKPADTYEADLGGGVSCRLPLALYAHAQSTLPRATARPKPSAKPADFPPTGDDRDTRLACVCLAWGVLQHFYPYFEETKADWPDALREALTAAATDADAAAFHRTMCRLIARLEDSHGAVRPGSGAPRLDGALPLSWDVVEGKLAVTWVDPAARLRIKVGDVVESIAAPSTCCSCRSCTRSRGRRASSTTTSRVTWRPSACGAWRRNRPGATPRPRRWPGTSGVTYAERRLPHGQWDGSSAAGSGRGATGRWHCCRQC